jgi:hypothetical protein
MRRMIRVLERELARIKQAIELQVKQEASASQAAELMQQTKDDMGALSGAE